MSQHKLYLRLFTAGLVAVDAAAVSFALWEASSRAQSIDIPFTSLLGFGLPAVLLMFWINGLYGLRNLIGGTGEYGRVFGSVNVAFLILLSASYVSGFRDLNLGDTLHAWTWMLGSLLVGRFAMRRLSFVLRGQKALRQRTLIVGACSEGTAIARQWADVPSAGVEVVGFLDDDLAIGAEVEAGAPVIARTDDLAWAITETSADCVMIADPSVLRDRLERDDRILETLSKVEVIVGTGASELLTSSVHVWEEGFIPLISLDKRRVTGVHNALKTVLDYTLTIVGLILISPIMLAVAALIRISSPGPVIYKHRRIGIHRNAFYAYKFRSMYMDGDKRLTPEQRKELEVNMKLENDPRITKIGAFIRKTSLDELPQLFNVLRGQMSLVGPRPVVEPELERFGKWQHARATVKPGLTGLWQVSGRSDLSYEDRVRLDLWYVRNYTIWLDIKILAQTIPAVLFRKGAY